MSDGQPNEKTTPNEEPDDLPGARYLLERMEAFAYLIPDWKRQMKALAVAAVSTGHYGAALTMIESLRDAPNKDNSYEPNALKLAAAIAKMAETYATPTHDPERVVREATDRLVAELEKWK